MSHFALQLASQVWAQQWGRTLLHFLWQGTIISTLYAVVRLWLGPSNPPKRYAAACTALACMMAAPLVTFSLIRSPGVIPDTVRVAVPATQTAPVTHALALSVDTISSAALPEKLIPWVVILWLAGAVALWLRLIGGWILATRMKSTRVLPAPLAWQQTLDQFRTRLRLSTPVRLMISALVQVPTVVGWLRPVVLVPVGALTGLAPACIEALLIHELAHIRRHDYLVNLLQSAAEALLFYHPAIWWISSHIRAEREQCCDDIAVSVSGDALTYVRALADLESSRPAHFTPAMAANGGSLAVRIARLLGQPQPACQTGAGVGVIAGAFALILTASAVSGQSPSHPEFEVASIKPNNSGANTLSIRIVPGGRLTSTNATLRSLITEAYQVREFQITGGPAWLGSARFDIDARGGGGPPPAQILQMLQTLLADRFQLKVHRETKELPVYDLLIATNGPKFDRISKDECFDPQAGLPPPTADARPCGGFNMGSGRMAGAKVPMSRFVLALARFLGRTVVDKTGLDGTYDISLQWTPDETQAFLPPPEPVTERSGPSLFTAVEEQLGLKLEAQKGPVEILVIDRAEKPAAN